MTVKEIRYLINNIYLEMGTKYREYNGLTSDFKGHVQWQMSQRFPGYFPSYCVSGKGMKKEHLEKMLEIVLELHDYFEQIELAKLQEDEQEEETVKSIEEEATIIQTVQSVNVNVIKQAIQTTLAAMNQILDNDTWIELHQRYLHLKSELDRLDSG